MPEVKFLKLPMRLKWVNSTLNKKLLNISFAAHLLLIGKTESGKTYFLFQLIEWLFKAKTHKFFLLNCYEQPMLEEALGLIFPNTNPEDKKKIAAFNSKIKDPAKKVKPLNIKLKVYVPLMPNDLPDQLPAIYQPFTIPVNDWSEECVQILYGDRDTTKIYQTYSKNIKKAPAMSFPKVKRLFKEMEMSSVRWETGIGGIQTIAYDENSAYKTIGNFQTRLNNFNNIGILSSPKNPHCLRKILKKDLRDLNTVSILDLTKLKDNKMLQFFVISYFIKCLEDELDELDVIPYKVATVMDEARFIMAKTGEGKRSIHMGIQDMVTRLLTYGRHKNIEVWLSTQSPANLGESVFKNMIIRAVTYIDEYKDIEWLCSNFKQWKKDSINDLLEKLNYLREYKNDYRFILLSESLDDQLSGRNPNNLMDVGYKFPYPRTNMYYTKEESLGRTVTVFKPNIRNNYKLIIEQLKANGMEEPILDMKPVKESLINEWNGEEMKIKHDMDKNKRKKEDQDKEKELEEKKVIDKIAETRQMLREQGEDDTKIAKIAKLTGISRDRIRSRWAKTEEMMPEKPEKAPI